MRGQGQEVAEVKVDNNLVLETDIADDQRYQRLE